MPSLDRSPRYGNSHPRNGGRPKKRGPGPAAVRQSLDLGSDDSAQKTIDAAFRRAVRVSQILTLTPGADLSPVVAHLAHLNALLETGPARPLTEALLKDGMVSRAQDEARECCLVDGETPSELDLLEARVRREIAEGFAVLRDIHAHREAAR